MSYTKRQDIQADTRAIADLGGGAEARIVRIVETTADGVMVELESGNIVLARRIIKPAMTGMVVELGNMGTVDNPDAASGELVQAEYLVKSAGESMTPVVHVLATWIDAQGNGLAGVDRRPVFVEFKHNASQQQQDELGMTALVRECLMLVLGELLTLVQAPGGEPEDLVTLIPWDPENVRAVDIRRAIKIAKDSTEVELADVL